jgi:hypothetical protein
MESEERVLDEMLDRGEESAEIAVGDDAGVQKFVLGKDMAVVMVVATPVVEVFGDAISLTSY